MTVEVLGYRDEKYVYPTGAQIDVDHGPHGSVLIVTDATGKTVALVNGWSEAHIVYDPSAGQ